MNKKLNLIIFLVIVLAVFSRLFITIPNFSAIGALALFCGAIAYRNKLSILIPFIALIFGDVLLALKNDRSYTEYFSNGHFIFIYVAYIGIWFIGSGFKNRLKFSNIIFASVISSVAFFLFTNFGSWLQLPYAKTLGGLGQSYLAGLVFYKGDLLSNFFLNQVVGDLFFTTLFFGCYFLITREDFSKLRPIKVKN
ncbi:MAG: DUF6580 family putative transport protein [Bacteroidia bacterium]